MKSCGRAAKLPRARLPTPHRCAAGRSSTSTTSCRPTPVPTSTSLWVPAATRSAVSPTDLASRADLGDQAALGRSLVGALHRDGAVSVSAFDRVIAAVDASHYLITPRAVVTPTGIDEVAALLTYASAA